MKKKSPKKPSQPKSNYSKQKYPALNSRYQVANRRELIDYDYINKLSPEEKKWLDKFTSEYVITNFKDTEAPFHNEKERKELYKSNNKRNNDAFATKKANNHLSYGANVQTGQSKVIEKLDTTTAEQVEDHMLTQITIKRYLKNKK